MANSLSQVTIALLIFGPAPASFANPGEQEASWYVGGGDVSSAKLTTVMNSGFYSPGFTPATTRTDNSATGWKVFGGYLFNRNLAFEGGYAVLGNFFGTTSTAAAALHSDVRATAWHIDTVGILPLGNGFSVAGRVGLVRSTTKVSLTGVGAVIVPQPRYSSDKVSYKMGLGADYNFTHYLGARAEVERYRISGGASDCVGAQVFSISAHVKF